MPAIFLNRSVTNPRAGLVDFSQARVSIGSDTVETPVSIPNMSTFPEVFINLQITRGILDFPTCNASFYKKSEELRDSIRQIAIGNEYLIMGIPFVLASYNVTSLLISTQRVCRVDLSFVSKYAPRGSTSPLNPLDRPTRFADTTTLLTASDISINATIGDSAYERYFTGLEPVEIVPRNEIEAAFLLSSSHLICYSGRTILGKSLSAPPVGTLTYNHIFEESVSYPYNELPRYIDTEVTLESIPSNEVAIVERLEFENATDITNVSSPYNSPNDLRTLENDMKNPASVFDNGGRTKTMKRITEIDGQPLAIIETVYGYVFNMNEMVIMPPNGRVYFDNSFNWPIRFHSNLANRAGEKWRVVQTTTTFYRYDADGYLVGINKSGWKLARIKRETDEYETVQLILRMYKKHSRITGGNNRPGLEPSNSWKADAREYNAYTFFNPIDVSGDSPVFASTDITARSLYQYPIQETTYYFLDNLTNYYDDIPLDNGVHPKYVYKTYSHSQSAEIVPNPKDDPSDRNSPYQPLILFKERKELTTTQIIIPSSLDSPKRTPEMFTTTTYTHSQETEYGTNSLAIGNTIQSTGRPSAQTRIRLRNLTLNYPQRNYHRYRYFLNGRITDDTTNIGSSIQQGNGQFRFFGNNQQQSSEIRTSIGREEIVSLSTASFTGAATPRAAEIGAKSTLEREFINSHKITVHVSFKNFYQALKEGDIWNFVNEFGDSMKVVIVSISYNLDLTQNGEYFCKEGIELVIAPAKTASVSISQRPRIS